MFATVEDPPPSALSDVTSVLRRRGLEPLGVGRITETLYPEDQLLRILQTYGQFEYFEKFPGPGRFKDHYLDLFGRASFRKMIKRLLRDGRQPVELAELEQIAGSSMERYLKFLEAALLVQRTSTTVRLIREIPDLGRSLEHYVAELCVGQLRGSAEWGVVLQNLPRSGGDFDVLAWLEPSLVYVECKTSRPSNIGKAEIREFLQRGIELAPDLAILLIDTDDDLETFVDERMNQVLRETKTLGIEGEHFFGVRKHPDYPRIFHGFIRIYVINSKNTILAQLDRCLQHYYAHVKGRAWPEFVEPVNFTGAAVRDV